MNYDKSLNPFALGGIVGGERFAGRGKELLALRRLGRSSERVYVFAPRRYGKSSLIREAFATEAVLLVWCDCLPTNNAQDLATRLGEAVVRGVRTGRLQDWIMKAAGLFRRLRPTLTPGQDGQVSVGIEVGPATSEPGVEDALEAIGRLAASEKKPVVVVLDEFQQVAAWDRDHQMEAIIRTVVQGQQRVSYIFAGSQRRLLHEMFADRRRPLFQLAAPFPLTRLSPDELRPWLQARFGESGVTVAVEGLHALVAAGAGHPWATQYLSHFVWDAAVASDAGLNPDTVKAGLDRALEAGGTIYSGDYATLTPPQRRVLLAAAMEPTGSPTGAAYLRQHHLPSKSTASQALKSLVEKGYVERENDVYLAADPLFAEWLRRQ